MKGLKFSALLLLSAFSLGAQDMAVATVRYKRTEPVSSRQLNDIIEVMEEQQGKKLSQSEKKEVLDQLIDEIIVLQAAEADRTIKVIPKEIEEAGIRILSQQLIAVGALPPGAVLTDKEQYKAIIERQNMTLKEFEDTIRRRLLTEKFISSQGKDEFTAIQPANAEEMEVEYQKRVQEFVVSDSVWFKQVFFDIRTSSPAELAEKRAKAEEIQRSIVNGAGTFADMVESKSEDPLSKSRGGLIGPVMKGDELTEQLYGNEFVNTLFNLKLQETSKVLKSKIGYHIVMITEKKAAQLLPKDSPEVKSYLEQLVYAQKFQKKFLEITERVVKDLRKQSTINYFGEYKE